MPNMYKDLHGLSDFYYDIAAIGFKKVGKKKLHPDVSFDWFADSTQQFPHWSYGRIWCVDEGSAHVVTTQGELELKANHAYYIPQGTLVSARCDEYMVQYFIDFLSFSDFIPLENMFVFKQVSDEYELILSLIKEILSHKKDRSELQNYKRTAYMNAILSHFIDKLKLPYEKFEPFLQVITKINNTYKDNISISSLAKSVGYNSEYFSRTFKSTFGISPQSYIINKRLSVAKHYLLTTNLSISAIANECGYTDPLYFTKAFTKQMGISPSMFRFITKSNE